MDLKIECKYNLEFLPLYLGMKYEEKNETKIHLFLRQFYFTKHILIPNTSERVSRVNWFSSGIQSAFRESIGLVRGFRTCFVSQLVQFGNSECVSRVNWFRSGL